MVDSRHFRLLTLFLGLTLASSASADEGAIAVELDRYLSAVSKTTTFSGSVLVAKDGEILVRAGYGLASRELDVPNTAATRYRIGSLTKTFSALGILQLCDKGALSLVDPLSKFLPKFPRGDQISVEHLLNHTSGLPPSWREDWHEKRQLDLAEVIDLFKDSPPVAPPGQEEHYSNPGYAVLARIIEVVSGLTYDVYMQKHVFDPVGMKSTGTDYPNRITTGRAQGYVIGMDEDGMAAINNAAYLYLPSLMGQASMISSIDDLHRYDQSLRAGEIAKGACRSQLFAVKEPSEFTLGSWWVEENTPLGPLIYFSGISSGFESVMYRYSAAVIVVLANHQSANVFDIADNLTAILAGRGYHLPKVRSAVKLDPELSTQYAGEYEFESGEGFQILSLNGRLFVESHGDPPEEIFPANGGEFFSRLHDLQIRFALDTDHKVEGALWTYRGEQVKARKID